MRTVNNMRVTVLFLSIFLFVFFSLCNAIPTKSFTVNIAASQLGKKRSSVALPLPLISNLPNGVKNGIASALASAVVKFSLQPFDTLKSIQQMDSANIGLYQTSITFIAKRGIFGLWSGAGVTVLGSVPSVALYFGVFNSAKVRLAALMPPQYRPVAVALAAALGNTIASFLRVPCEVQCV